MTRRQFLEGLIGSAAMPAINAETAGAAGAPFRTRGIYFHDGFTCEERHHAPLYWDFAAWQRQIRWLHACGINAIEFATMLEFNRIPSTPMERQKIADRLKILDFARSLGMKFGYLLTNTVLSAVPPEEEPGHQLLNRAVTLCPRQPGNFERTIAVPIYFMETYREADFFEQFAADWGGCACGACGVPEYLRYVRVLADRLKRLNPRATLYANTWCISYWGRDLMPQGWKAVFDREIAGSREVIEALPALPDNVGLGLPCHHLYRPLAFSSYGSKAQTPVFPTEADLQPLRRAQRPLLAWTHFVMDDDAYRPQAWGIVHSETRYLQALLKSLRAARIDQVIGNLYLPMLQLPNTFAFGRLLENPDREPQAILHDFARLIAHRDDAEKLAEALTWMENQSYWERQMPPDGRLPHLPCTLDRAGAQRLAAGIRPHPSPPLPLPLSAQAWLDDFRRSLARMDWAD